MMKDHIITTIDDQIHEILCIDYDGNEQVIAFQNEIQLNNDIDIIQVCHEEEAFSYHDDLYSKLVLHECDDAIVLCQKCAEVCFTIENATKDHQIIWSQQNESLTICLYAENDYTQGITHVNCGMSMLMLPPDLYWINESGEHYGNIELCLKPNTIHHIVLKQCDEVQLKISALALKEPTLITMKHPHFQQSFYLNEQNHYQIQLSQLIPETYLFECDKHLNFVYQHRLLSNCASITIGKQPIHLRLVPKKEANVTFIFHNPYDEPLSFSLFSLHYHQQILLESYQSLKMEHLPMGAYSLMGEEGYRFSINSMVQTVNTFWIECSGIYHISFEKLATSNGASLQIQWYEESLQASMQTPSEQSQKLISLIFNETRYDILLNMQNHFQVYLPSLPFGVYQLVGCEQDCLYFDQEECHSASLCLQSHHCLKVVSSLKRLYRLHIQLCMEDDVCFEEEIKGILQNKKETIPFCLNRNQSYIEIESLEAGEYQVLLPSYYGMETILQYQERFLLQPLFTLCKDSELCIYLKPLVYGGTLRLRLLQELATCEIVPCSQQQYHIQMKGYGYSQTHCFNENNGYEIVINHIKAQVYQLSLCDGYQMELSENSFELTQEDLDLDIILKYRNEDVVIRFEPQQECVCLLCHHQQEEILRFYEGNQYQCILSGLAYGSYQIKGFYDQTFTLDTFDYQGDYLELTLSYQQICEIHIQMDENNDDSQCVIAYEHQQQRKEVILSSQNDYHTVISVSKKDIISFKNDHLSLYIEGELYHGENIEVHDEILHVNVRMDESRCVLMMEQSECSCMEDEISFNLYHDGQKEKISFHSQRGITLPKGLYQFESNQYRFEIDGMESNTFHLQQSQHHLMVYPKHESYTLFIKGYQECSGTIHYEKESYPFVLHASNQYSCMMEHLVKGIYHIEVSNHMLVKHHQQIIQQIELLQNEEIEIQAKSYELQIVKYEKRNGIYSRKQLKEITFRINEQEYVLNEENDYQIKIVLNKDMFSIKSEHSITYLYDGKEHENGEHISSQIQLLGIVETLQNQGNVKIHAMIETSGGYRHINQEDQIELCLNGFNQEILLDAKHQYMHIIENLDYGIYEIQCNQEVSYLWNGEVQEHFMHYGDDVLFIIVSNQKHHLTLTLDEPCESANVTVWNQAKPTFVHLNQEHHQQVIVLEGEGPYVIDDEEDLRYCMNGCNEVRYPVLKGNQSYHIVIHKHHNEHQHCLSITKKIMKNNQLVQPNGKERFEVDILSDHKRQRIVLDDSNQFEMILKDLPCGHYEIKEVNVNDYETSYIVNDGIRSNRAVLHLQQDTHVCIVNEVSMKQGSLIIKKVIENINGELITPADGDEYQVLLKSSQFEQVFHLNTRNQFQQNIGSLAEGIYSLKELNDEYYVQYQVNQEGFKDEAKIVIQNGQSNEVIIKNIRQLDVGRIDIFQYIQQKDGAYQKPTEGSFPFLLIGKDVRKEYDLNQDNDYEVSIDGLLPGVYQVLSKVDHSAYLMDDAQLQKEVNIDLKAEEEVVIAIVKLNVQRKRKANKAVLTYKL